MGPDGALPGVTAGTLLRQAREAAGLHIAALAVSLKVPVRKLEALESDRLDLLPDAVFVRALASSVCRTLKIDPAPVLERLPQTAAPRLVPDASGINTPFRGPSDGKGPSWLDQLSKPVFLAVFALLLGALVLILLPSVQRDGTDASTDTVSTPVLPPAGTMAAAAAAEVADAARVPDAAVAVVTGGAASSMPFTPHTTPTLNPAMSTPTVISPTVVVTPSATLAKAVPPTNTTATAAAGPASAPKAVALASRPAASAPQAAASVPRPPASAAAAAAPLPTTGTVVLKAKGETWVEVVDAKGVIAVRKTLAPGETVGASGAHPLSVVIGRVDQTDVQVRGKPFDMSAVARDNVARFEVK